MSVPYTPIKHSPLRVHRPSRSFGCHTCTLSMDWTPQWSVQCKGWRSWPSPERVYLAMHSASMQSSIVRWTYRIFRMTSSTVRWPSLRVSWIQSEFSFYLIFSNLIAAVIYNKSEIALVWKAFEAPTGNYPIFKIKYYWTEPACEEWRNPIKGNPCIYGSLKLVRRLPFYIIRIYLLSFLTVAISLVNFWVPINAWPARVRFFVNLWLNL